MLKETAIENAILEYLTYKNIFAWKNPTTGYFDPRKKRYVKQKSRFCINGVSDIIAIDKNGNVFFLEVKSKTGRQSDYQKIFEDNIKKYHGNYFVVRSIEDVEKIIKEF